MLRDLRERETSAFREVTVIGSIEGRINGMEKTGGGRGICTGKNREGGRMVQRGERSEVGQREQRKMGDETLRLFW